MGTHLRVLSESYPVYTNMTGFSCFFKLLCPAALDISSLSIGRVNIFHTYIENILLDDSVEHDGNEQVEENAEAVLHAVRVVGHLIVSSV